MCNFKQIRTVVALTQTVESSGRLYYMSPDKLLWSQIKPASYQMLLTDNNIIIRTDKGEENLNLSSNRMFKELSKIIVGGINGSLFNDYKNYNMMVQQLPDKTTITLTPKNNQLKRFLNYIVVNFDAEWLATDILIHENGGNSTLVIISDRIVNNDINPSIFK